MNTGIEVTNSYREQSWIYKYFMTDNPQAAILAIRTFLEDNLGIEAGHYTAINTSPDQVLVAVNQDMITKACDAREATLDIIHAIRHGAQRNGQPLTREHCPAFLTERLARGADLRTVDTKGARSGYTLADVMRKYEAYGLLVAFRQLQSLPSDRTIRSYEPTIS